MKKQESNDFNRWSVKCASAFGAGDLLPFKGWNRYDSFKYPQYGNGVVLKDGRLALSKVGTVRIFQHRPIPPNMTIKTCTIRRDVDKWYACFTTETTDVPKTQRQQETRVGVDVGLNSLVTLSNGEKVQPPRFLRKMEKKEE